MAELLSEKNVEILADAEHARLWDLLIHQEKGLAVRTNFFLMCESVLILTYGIVISFALSRSAFFAIIGLTVSIMWLLLQYKTLSDLSALSRRLKRVEISKHYLAWREESAKFIISHEIIAVVIPALSLVGWFIALAFSS
jgi:hypothetical protein